MPADAEDFTHVSRKKVRTPKNRKGKSNRPRERSVAERVEARQGALVESGYLAACRGESDPRALRMDSRLIFALQISYAALYYPHPSPALLLPVLRPSRSSASAWAVSPTLVNRKSSLSSYKSSSQRSEMRYVPSLFALPFAKLRLFPSAIQLQAKTTIYDPVFAEEDYEYFLDEGLDALKAEVSFPFTSFASAELTRLSCLRSLSMALPLRPSPSSTCRTALDRYSTSCYARTGIQQSSAD